MAEEEAGLAETRIDAEVPGHPGVTYEALAEQVLPDLKPGEEGRWTTLTDWTADPVIAPAGEANILAVEDAGGVVRVLVNDQIVFQTRAISLPPGDVGVMAGSLEQSVAEVDFDWIRLTAIVE